MCYIPLVKEVQDHWFRLAKEEGYRSRAAYKFIDIDDRKGLLRRGDRVLDAGAAPGSWSQVAAARVGPRGEVVAVDLKPINPNGYASNVRLIQADLRDLTTEDLGGRPFDAVISDMAPDTTGDPGGDSIRSARLCHELLDRCPGWLRKGGNLTMKVFEGGEYPELLKRAGRMFEEAKGYKPRASRAESVEMFVVCLNYRGNDGFLQNAATASLPKRKPSKGWATEE
ncbi:MAG: RlmE family RNA methyltransferase [Planctomycetota bacterium]|nr:MAG: RlmE family RNA methyltransferase [Planctomycetota bacterium]